MTIKHYTEKLFEKVTSVATSILGSSITFILALMLVIFWWARHKIIGGDLHENIGDLIFGITFISLFVIQKSFNKFSASLHLKLNELISSHEPANNAVIDLAEKTETEITALSAEYTELVEIIKEVKDEIHS
jgi:low affinity Fe/Cu permease